MGRPDGKAAGEPILFPRLVWTWLLIQAQSVIAMD